MAMILVFDVFGVIYGANGLNKPLLAAMTEPRRLGHKIYLASNMNQDEKTQLWPKLQPYATDLFCSADLGTVKPEPAFYHAVTTALAALPHDIVFFDDSPTNVAAANHYGWQAFLYTDAAQVAQTIKKVSYDRVS